MEFCIKLAGFTTREEPVVDWDRYLPDIERHRDSYYDKELNRMVQPYTEGFDIEKHRAYWKDGSPQLPGPAPWEEGFVPKETRTVKRFGGDGDVNKRPVSPETIRKHDDYFNSINLYGKNDR